MRQNAKITLALLQIQINKYKIKSKKPPDLYAVEGI